MQIKEREKFNEKIKNQKANQIFDSKITKNKLSSYFCIFTVHDVYE
jgi:hypothetical protein